MKMKYKKLMVTCLLVTVPFIMTSQGPPHPNNGSDPGAGNTPVENGPSGTPIDGGLIVLLALAGVYASKQGYCLWKGNKG